MNVLSKRITAILCIPLILLGLLNAPGISIPVKAAENESWDFEFTGNIQEFTAPYTGRYYLDLHGAGSNGNPYVNSNGGGHSTGFVNLVAGEKLYIQVGEMGVINGAATYNGGGAGRNGARAGSGATSITKTNRGELKNFAFYKSEVVIVAGGSGGQGSNEQNGINNGGGGLSTSVQEHSNEAMTWGHGAGTVNATNGYAFGLGQDSPSSPESTHGCGGYGGAGGGGYYGGYHSNCGDLPGGGGSGYVNNNLVYNGFSDPGTWKGNGKATIRFDGEVHSDLVIDLNGHGTYNKESGVIKLNHVYGESIDIAEPVDNEGYKFLGWKVEYGSVKPETGSYTYDFNDSYIIAQWAGPLVVNSEVDLTAYNNKGGMNFYIEQKDTLEKVMTIVQSKNGSDYYNVFENSQNNSPNVYRKQFNYTGGSQTYSAISDGLYRLEAYGPNNYYLSYDEYHWGPGGGSAIGYVGLKKNSNLYVSVGGTGGPTYGGWNGGGNGKLAGAYKSSGKGPYPSNGGAGATHISNKIVGDGQLKNYNSYRNNVLLVAGGAGGGVPWTSGGAGGGYSGGKGQNYTPTGSYGWFDVGTQPGSQSGGYTFGQGQNAGVGSQKTEFFGGGGGGWYGGQAYTGTQVWGSLKSGGCGGSGHLGNVLNGSMSTGSNSRAGYVVITLTQEYLTGDVISNIYTPDLAAPNVPFGGELSTKEEKILLGWQTPDDNGTKYWHKITSYFKDDSSISGLGDMINQEIVEDTILTGVVGFRYFINNSPTGTVTASNAFLEESQIEIPTSTQTRYLHVAAVDGAGNISDTYTMEIPSVAKYVVNHYAQNEDGSYTLVKTEEKMGQIGSTVTPDVIPQTGRDNPPAQSIVITADGKAQVDYYYDVTRFDAVGNISWNDHENLYGTRPSEIGVTIYRDGEYFDYVTVPATDTTNKYSFDQLQKYDLETGREFEYTVFQDVAYSQAALEHSEDKYTTIQNGFDFLNGIRNTERPVKPGSPDEPENPDDKGFHVEGEIYWDDNENSLGFRPSEVTITIYQKGEDGEWKEFDEYVITNTKNNNHYIFDWLPKYWYDENDVPTAFEYKVEESFSSWYVKDGEIKDFYVIHEDQPNDFDFTNELIPDGPIIPVSEYTNTIIVKTNTDESVRIVLKPLEVFIHDDYSVSYGDPTGNDIPVMSDKTGTSVSDLTGTRYEIILDSPEYTLEYINLSLSENMELEKIGDKWYVTILNVPADAIGTLEIELSKKEQFYQDRQSFMNYFAAGLKVVTNELPEYFNIKISNMVAVFNEAEEKESITITYMDSDTEDLNKYLPGDKAAVLDYLGKIPVDCEFIGWSILEDSSEADYLVGDEIEISESIVLFPVFDALEDKEAGNMKYMEDMENTEIKDTDNMLLP